jgi:hypothetical protein
LSWALLRIHLSWSTSNEETLAAVSEINKQNLPWRAALRAPLEGRTLGSFGTGFKPLPEAVRRQHAHN